MGRAADTEVEKRLSLTEIRAKAFVNRHEAARLYCCAPATLDDLDPPRIKHGRRWFYNVELRFKHARALSNQDSDTPESKARSEVIEEAIDQKYGHG